MLPKRRPGQCLRFAGGQEGGLFPGRIDPTASRPTQPRPPSPPRRAPPRPDRPVVCPGFGFDRLMEYRGIHTFLSMLVYAAVTAHGVARVCGDHRVLRSVLVSAAIINITLVALFSSGFVSKAQIISCLYTSLYIFFSCTKKDPDSATSWSWSEVARRGARSCDQNTQTVQTHSHVFFWYFLDLYSSVEDVNIFAMKSITQCDCCHQAEQLWKELRRCSRNFAASLGDDASLAFLSLDPAGAVRATRPKAATKPPSNTAAASAPPPQAPLPACARTRWATPHESPP